MMMSSTISYRGSRCGCGHCCSTCQVARYNPCDPRQEALHPGVDTGRVGGTPTAITGHTQEDVAVVLLEGEGSPAVPLAGVLAGRVGTQPAGWMDAGESC